MQRRHQKVVEETPSPVLTDVQRAELMRAAVRAGEAVGYLGAGTVEFLFSPERGEFVFLEMNTRLQVEHPITELVWGIDLVEAQLRVAAGEPLAAEVENPQPRGHAVELRLYAEDPVTFLPSPGVIGEWAFPEGEGARVDAGYGPGDTVSPYYDPLLAKVCAWGADREEALSRARGILADMHVTGITTNAPLLERILANAEFVEGSYDTGLLERMPRG